MNTLYPYVRKSVMFSTAVIFSLVFSASLMAQCPSDGVCNVAGTYSNGDTLYVTNNFSGNVTLNSGARMIVSGTGNYTGIITTSGNSYISVHVGGVFNPSAAAEFSASITNNYGGRVVLGTGLFSIGLGFTIYSSGIVNFEQDFYDADFAATITNTACGVMNFKANAELGVCNTKIINDGLLNITGKLTTFNGTEINNRGRMYTDGDLETSGKIVNQYRMVFRGNSNVFNNGDSLVNTNILVFQNSIFGAKNIRNEGLFWMTSGAFQFNAGSITQNNPNALMFIDGHLMINYTFAGTGNLYVSQTLQNNGTLAGLSPSQPLAINQIVVGGVQTNVTHNAGMIAYDSITYTQGWSNEGICTSSLMPLELKEFKAIQQQENIVLNWITATETETSKFIIEHSTDGKSFSYLGEINAHGSSNKQIKYQYTDKKVSQSNHYYRLKMISKNGAIEYSGIAVVKIASTKKAGFKVKNSFFTSTIYATLDQQQNTSAIIRLYDLSGKIMVQQKIQTTAGQSTIALHGLGNLAKGMYVLEFSSADKKWAEKVIK